MNIEELRPLVVAKFMTWFLSRNQDSVLTVKHPKGYVSTKIGEEAVCNVLQHQIESVIFEDSGSGGEQRIVTMYSNFIAGLIPDFGFEQTIEDTIVVLVGELDESMLELAEKEKVHLC